VAAKANASLDGVRERTVARFKVRVSALGASTQQLHEEIRDIEQTDDTRGLLEMLQNLQEVQAVVSHQKNSKKVSSCFCYIFLPCPMLLSVLCRNTCAEAKPAPRPEHVRSS
jgi:hypothetical protein